MTFESGSKYGECILTRKNRATTETGKQIQGVFTAQVHTDTDMRKIYLFIYLGFYVAFNTVQVISRQVVGRAEETST